MKPAPFRYERAESVEHALERLSASDARVLAGGQSLVPLMNMRRVRPAAVVDITRVDELSTAAATEDSLEVGALVTQAEFEALAERCPLALDCLPFTGHFATRNRGTVGGSIAHADPRGELPLALLTLGGSAQVARRGSTRTVAAEDLFAGPYSTTLAPDELLLSTSWPTTSSSAFEELAQRHGDYTLAAAACALCVEGERVTSARIGVGAVADRPLLAPASNVLIGRPVDSEAAREAGRLAAEEIEPLSDLHGSAAYRRHLVAVLVERVVMRAWSRA